jgi:transposase
MPRPIVALAVTPTERQELERHLAQRKLPIDLKLRIQIILGCADGLGGDAIALALGITAQTVSKWRRRYAQFRFAGLSDAPGRGRARSISDEIVQCVVDRVRQTKPSDATHWSTRTLARELGSVSHSTVQRIWSTFGLKPHLQESFKLSTDPHFVDKVQDIVGLYMAPPERALVLCIDEKTQIQALDRTQRSLPLDFGHAESKTHDYQRFGTSSLFAALDVATGQVIGQLKRRHRSAEFIDFLNTVAKNVPSDQPIHLIMDNASTHKTDAVRAWFAKRPNFHAHFTPTSASWLNQVERFFSTLSEKWIKRGTHRSVQELEKSIHHYLREYNKTPKPFVWTKSADYILEKVKRAADKLMQGICETPH